jgi:hypothetical protein
LGSVIEEDEEGGYNNEYGSGASGRGTRGMYAAEESNGYSGSGSGNCSYGDSGGGRRLI